MGFCGLQNENDFNKKRFADMEVALSMTLRVRAKCYYKCGHTIFITRRYPLKKQ